MVAVDLDLIGAIVDGFVWIKQWPMDQVVVGFLDVFVGFFSDCWKSKSNRSKMEALSMHQPINPLSVQLIRLKWRATIGP